MCVCVNTYATSSEQQFSQTGSKSTVSITLYNYHEYKSTSEHLKAWGKPLNLATLLSDKHRNLTAHKGHKLTASGQFKIGKILLG